MTIKDSIVQLGNINSPWPAITIFILIPTAFYILSYIVLPLVRSKVALVLSVVSLIIVNVVIPLYIGFIVLQSQNNNDLYINYLYALIFVILFNSVLFNGIVKEGFLKGWIGKEKYRAKYFPPLADDQVRPFGKKAQIRIISAAIVSPFIAFILFFLVKLISLFIYEVNDTLVSTLMYLALGMFFIVVISHLFLIQYLLKCDNCGLPLLPIVKTNSKYGNFLRVALVILLKSEFHCLHCEASYCLNSKPPKREE
ncbi:hypothetical protein [Piscirickettsia litoralis]|uniref:RDD domain-containing protein n=1 Tax=Piscirickettsia litoralis TaxID=1891921 RepID=A0ABX2ZWI4_9GAMM|nr:hypothetical protein [Piscirickettsia litoralis]ODN40984.1 hypothetical protein BGC07_18685 [Piscirickettsia litoralis]